MGQPVTRRPPAAADDEVADVLAAAPEYSEWQREGDVLRDRANKLARQIAAAQAAQNKANEDHAAAVTDAVRSGQPIPEPPSGVDFSHLNRASATQRADEQSHRDRRAAVVASVADQVLAALRSRETDRQERLVALGAKLDGLVDEARRDSLICRDVFNAEDDVEHVTDRPTRSDRVPTPDAAGLLAAATSGVSLLEPRAMPPRNLEEAGMILVDRSHPWQHSPEQPDLHGLQR